MLKFHTRVATPYLCSRTQIQPVGSALTHLRRKKGNRHRCRGFAPFTAPFTAMSTNQPINCKRVLSIQSHVVRGYVGNKVAVFPLQLLGFDVDPINSVHFSNHTGYRHCTGKRLQLTGNDLDDILEGLEANGLVDDAYSHLLTGYIGSKSLLESIPRVLELLKKHQKHPGACTYVCDPVLGDHNRLYVSAEFVDLYRCSIVPIANVLTPNQFECEVLTQITLKSLSDALRACKKLHRMGPNVVVITSFSQERQCDGTEWSLVASRVIEGTKYCEQFEIRVPHIPQSFTGTGDFFTALLLAWLDHLPYDFAQALEHVVGTVQGALRKAIQSDTMQSEVNVVQSQSIIMKPEVVYRARSLSNAVVNVIVHVDQLSHSREQNAVYAFIKRAGVKLGANHIFLVDKDAEETMKRIKELLEARKREQICAETLNYSMFSLLIDPNGTSICKGLSAQQANFTARTALFVSPWKDVCNQFESASYQSLQLDDKHSWDTVLEYIDQSNEDASIDG
uniref:pyridoxal kinase n=1 Tax=Albugo laibachii Nc14 TaxID=890382 RepID=F0WLC3_9STRA|nr:pyridoxal kinase putative [Albugo laibachii Nc14]|eukprot:CCA22086.1 pyridoxal kinase putative [Albugo laibachii Nc14]